MRSTLEQRRSAWKHRSLFGVLLVLLAISCSRSGQAGHSEPAAEVRQIAAATVSPLSAAAPEEPASCPHGQVAVTPADVGIGDAVRCLPVGGDEVQGSRVDPLYGRVAAELVELIPGQTAEIAGTPAVVCWSQEDWLALSDSFRDAGEMEPLEYWFGWTRGNQGVINLSYPACKQLDGIAYRNGQLARQDTGAAVGTLAHETMHIAGIDDEGIADCYAMQLTAVTALELGAGREYADLLRTMNLEFNQANRSGTAYDSPDCYDGGPLDLAPESPRWP